MLVLVGGTAMAHRSASAHPLHTTLAELTCAPNAGVELVLRAFADDFAAAVAKTAAGGGVSGVPPHDSAAARYLSATVSLTDAAGQRAALTVVRTRRNGDLLWITMRAPQVRSLAGARLTNRVLFERYDDQVNIVQATVAGRRETLLFTKRDGREGKTL